MTIKVQLEFNQLRFEEFPTHAIEYCEDTPKSSHFHLQVTDNQTEKDLSVFLKYNDLLEKTIPIVSSHLNFEYIQFFKNIPLANRLITHCILEGTGHLSKREGIPGIYIASLGSSEHVFINLKKTPLLGFGSFGKIKKVLWLTAPDEKSQIIAKKVLRYHQKEYTNQEQYKQYVAQFNQEIATLNTFSEKRGIISMISGGLYGDKHAIFMPLYECSLFRYLKKPPFKITLEERLDLISQWLEGLATISEKGIHGDLSAGNLLLKRDENNKIKGVIADFGAFRPYGKEQHGVTTLCVGSPEYHIHELITSRHDVWSLGISLHEMFAKKWLPCWKYKHTEEMIQWASQLIPGWCLENFVEETPPFLMNLISDMLDPRLKYRLSAKDAFEYFLEGRASFADVEKLDAIEKCS